MFKGTFMKKAFTMLELIFVIIVIGILAAVIVPNTKRNPLQEAAVQVASHLRYTQHLSMLHDNYDKNDKDWYMGRWQIVFSNSQYTDNMPAYTIFRDQDFGSGYVGDPTKAEIAKNPENNDQLMTGGYGLVQAINFTHENFKGMEKLNLGTEYGVESVTFSGGCSGGARVAFDHLGRPLKGDHSSMKASYLASTKRLITSTCAITLNDGVESVVINVEPETGYVSLNFST